MKKFWPFCYFALFLLYFLFSFVFTDPNLTLLSAAWYLRFQTWLWQNILPQQELRTSIFLILQLLLFASYLFLGKQHFFDLGKSKKAFFQFLFASGLLLVFAYNALSYDIFNYLFNAKMVLQYHANPHINVALDFPQDTWLRFMNNVHTPAPYGYLWTFFSLPLFLLGLQKFLPALLVFKLASLALLLISAGLFEQFLKKENISKPYEKLAWVFLNPFILIELIANGHNDLWMLLPSFFAIFISRYWQKNLKNAALVILLLTISIGIKFATLSILPFVLYSWLAPHFHFSSWLKNLQNWFEKYYFDCLALVSFLPLLTDRSKQFLPWYLSWSLFYVILAKNRWLKRILLFFSFSSMLRYLPWVYYLPWMSFDQKVPDYLSWQKALTWGIPAILLLLSSIILRFNKNCAKTH